MFQPSRLQEDIFQEVVHGTTDIQVIAAAGSGKTKTIEEAAKRIPAALRSRTLMTAFNRHIRDELVARQNRGDIPREITISTIHSMGQKVLRNAFRPRDSRTWVDDKKYAKLARNYWSNLNLPPAVTQTQEYNDAVNATQRIAELAMLTLTNPNDPAALIEMCGHYGIEYPAEKETAIFRGVPQIIRWGREGLPYRDKDGRNYHPSECISFDDMIVLPVALNLPCETFALSFIDECQDFNRAQQELLLKLRGNGRAVWVGDPNQAIYGFTGADAEAFDRIQSRTGAKRMPLSICYRCGKDIISLAQTIVPMIEAHEAAPNGAVLPTDEERLVEMAVSHHNDPATRKEPFLLLCRTNAPLVGLAFDLIARGIPAKVKGRDIGELLVKTIDQIAELNDFSFEKFEEYANAYRRMQETLLARREGTELQIASLNDRIDSILAVHQAVVRDGRNGVAEMRSYIDSLFSNADEAITLSSIHKAKGLEAKRVGLLHPELLPHPMARQDWQVEQERNLAYVAITRAREELFMCGSLGAVSRDEAPEAPEATETPESLLRECEAKGIDVMSLLREALGR